MKDQRYVTHPLLCVCLPFVLFFFPENFFEGNETQKEKKDKKKETWSLLVQVEAHARKESATVAHVGHTENGRNEEKKNKQKKVLE